MSTILLTGATGTIGSALVPLLARGVAVRALARNPERAQHLTAAGVDVRRWDSGDPTSLSAAMAGVDAVFLACGNVPEQVGTECAVIDAAAAAGVSRIVKLSARGADPTARVAFWRWHATIEEHLHASGVPAVVLRPGFLMTNLLAAADQVRHQRMIFAPAGQARIAMIHPADVAAVAARVLTRSGHDGRAYVLTGPGAIGYSDVAAALSRSIGTPVDYVNVPAPAALSAMTDAGVPAFAAEQIVTVFEALRSGAQTDITDTVPMLTGRAARPITAFADEYAAAFGVHQPAVV
jgi:uncharacterized protein YbjT (DUF2867 family)